LVLADARNPEGNILFASDTDLAALSVTGETFVTPPFLGALLIHPMPEVSGRLALDGQLIAPDNRLFCIFSPDYRVLPFHFTADVRVPGLEPLPLSGTDHEVVRGGLATHPEGTSAAPQTIATLMKIAREYRTLTGSKLSVNDLSLPAGGVFDIFNT
jgi:hypothetical protein